MSSRYGKTADIVAFLRANGQDHAAALVAGAFLEDRLISTTQVTVTDEFLWLATNAEQVKAMVRSKLRDETARILLKILDIPGGTIDDLALEVSVLPEPGERRTRYQVDVFSNKPKTDDREYVWDAAAARAELIEWHRSITGERP